LILGELASAYKANPQQGFESNRLEVMLFNMVILSVDLFSTGVQIAIPGPIGINPHAS
jgi:hypothetical protein